MKIITEQQIRNLEISPCTCVDWVKECFLFKNDAQLPAKLSIHFNENNFFNTMPCMLPDKFNIFGVKIVRRIDGAVPLLKSEILLYDTTNGELLSILDGNWITAMRTGAVATLAIKTFRNNGYISYGIMGLGNTARATLICLLENEPDTFHEVNILKYKNQAELYIERFRNYKNVRFRIIDSVEQLISSSDVIVSCVTGAKGIICEDDRLFRKGCLVVPVHTRGFQNCDLFFDKVFADDTNHVNNFKYFEQFKYFAEIGDVLTGEKIGRISSEERILSYNIGLGLHDVYFASKIYSIMEHSIEDIKMNNLKEKFWL
ncbi:ornithine cyclodeaminase [uncultured Bacteroides sp.]|uniref:ornithine cyclodeaminase n=1 Tax=uncultured Bacteroides sp. TaxID=162156 RepID=UPI002602C828|nr:ornithine cyclodeaminase [uncultured Bacteroides sp.]